MNKFKLSLLAMFLFISVHALAYIPPTMYAALKNMYSSGSQDAGWSQDGNYYCANFPLNGFQKSVWFNSKAQWVMTQTDLGSLDQLSPTVYNAFVSGSYGSWVVENVTMVEFPRWQAIIAIEVGQDNVDVKYQLFYTPGGVLLRTRNVSYLSDILGPGTFL